MDRAERTKLTAEPETDCARDCIRVVRLQIYGRSGRIPELRVHILYRAVHQTRWIPALPFWRQKWILLIFGLLTVQWLDRASCCANINHPSFTAPLSS